MDICEWGSGFDGLTYELWVSLPPLKLNQKETANFTEFATFTRRFDLPASSLNQSAFGTILAPTTLQMRPPPHSGTDAQLFSGSSNLDGNRWGY